MRQDFILISRGQEAAGTFIRHHIGTVSSCQGLNFHGRIRPRGKVLLQFEGQNSLFHIDDRIIRIRRDSKVRHGLSLKISLHVLPSAFFIRAKNDPDLPLHLLTGLHDGFHAVQGADGGAFVVRRTPSVHPAVHNSCLIGRIGPSASLRHHIQMTKNRHGLVPLAELRVSGISVDILYAESQPFR